MVIGHCTPYHKFMSWSDDMRCLYCDGKLPLYRKITHGQFCSTAHRKAYWQKQEQLAIERLHQTHDSLHSYRSPVPEELILGPAPLAAAPLGPAPNITPENLTPQVPLEHAYRNDLDPPELGGFVVPELALESRYRLAVDLFSYESDTRPVEPTFPLFAAPERSLEEKGMLALPVITESVLGQIPARPCVVELNLSPFPAIFRSPHSGRAYVLFLAPANLLKLAWSGSLAAGPATCAPFRIGFAPSSSDAPSLGVVAGGCRAAAAYAGTFARG